MEESIDFAWSYFLNKKSELRNVMMSLIKDLKAKFGINVNYARCENAEKCRL